MVYALATRRRVLSFVGTSGARAARARTVLAIAALLAGITAAKSIGLALAFVAEGVYENGHLLARLGLSLVGAVLA